VATTDSDSDRLREFLYKKIAKRKDQIHLAHSPRFNHDMQLEIDCIEWFIYYRQISVYPFYLRSGFFIHYTLRNCEVLLFSFLYHIILQICHKELSTEQ
jgi:hypothetical protein